MCNELMFPILLFREFENQNVPNLIFMCHLLVMGLGFLLTIVVTAGYVAACENIRVPERFVSFVVIL